MNAKQRRKVARDLWEQFRSMATSEEEKVIAGLAQEIRKLEKQNKALWDELLILKGLSE